MKNIFGLNLTDKKASVNQDDFDGAVFITDKLSAEDMDKISAIQDDIEKQSSKLKLPTPLSIIKGVSYLIGMICVLGILKAKVSLEEAFNNAPGIFVCMFLFLGIAATLTVVEKIKRKKHADSNEFQEHLTSVDDMAKYAMEALNIPSNARSVDLLMYEYKVKNEKTVAYRKMYTHTPLMFNLYDDEKCLYLADHTMVFTFNKSDFKSIDRVKQIIVMSCWNKEVPFNSDEYKKYKIYANNLGTLSVKYYYSIKLASDFGEYEILVPPYEAQHFADILNLPLNEGENK